MIDLALIRRLLVWAGIAPPEKVQERQEVVKKVLTNRADEAELKQLAKMLDAEGVEDEHEEEDEEEEEQVQVYGPKSRGFKRSTREEGIGAELEKMNAEARGTPFFTSKFGKPDSTDKSRELLERLKKHVKADGHK